MLEFDEHAAYLKATKVFDAGQMDSALGRLKARLKGKSPAGWLEETRGSLALPAAPKTARRR